MALYLGFDASTHSLSAIVIEIDGDNRRTVFEHSLSFDRDFPEYGTTAGIVRGDESDEMLASPLTSRPVFGAPMGGYMNLVCFRNGSLTRDCSGGRITWTGRAFRRRSNDSTRTGPLVLSTR